MGDHLHKSHCYRHLCFQQIKERTKGLSLALSLSVFLSVVARVILPVEVLSGPVLFDVAGSVCLKCIRPGSTGQGAWLLSSGGQRPLKLVTAEVDKVADL